MIKSCLCLLAGVLGVALVPAQAQFQEWTADPLPGVQLKTVAFKGWVPARPEPLRGTLVLIPGRHGDGRNMAADPKWQELGTSVGFAVMGCQFADGDPSLYQNDQQGEVARAISAAVSRLAQLANHPELDKAPLAFWGTSAGSNVATKYADFFPARMIALASSKGTWGPNGQLSPAKEEIPMLFAIGEKDKPEWTTDSKRNLEAGLKKSAPWAYAFSKSEGHEVGKSLDLLRPFLKASIEQRFQASKPAVGGPSIFKTTPHPMSGTPKTVTATKLEKINQSAGWIGDPDTMEVMPAATSKVRKGKGVWLPDETTAKAWQDYLRP